MYRSTVSLSKIICQMWRDHPFSQRNKATERAVGVEVGDENKIWWTKFEKKGVGNIGGSS